MGRWAQRSRSGGGPPSVTQQYGAMILAVITANDEIQVTYNKPVTAGLFTLIDFAAQPAGEPPINIAQVDPYTIELAFANPINTETDLESAQTSQGLQNPQSIPLTTP